MPYLAVTQGSGSGTYSNYQIVGISAWAPATGNHFTYWTSNVSIGNASSSTTYVTLGTTSAWAQANYAWNYYTVTYSAGTGGSISGDGSQSVRYGLYSDSVTAVADAGYHFVSWSDGSTSASRSDGPITATLSRSASFAADSPDITSIDVSEGNSGGGDTVVITGIRFTSASSVKFGTTEATSFTVDSATQITAISPAHVIGAVDISVTTPVGTDTLASAYTYVTPEGFCDGSVTPTGLIYQMAIGHHISGSCTPIGSLSFTKSSLYAILTTASCTPSGSLFIYVLRPNTLYAPFVPTTLNVP